MKKAISCVLAVSMCSAPLNVFAEPILEGKLRAVEKSVTEKLKGNLEVDLNFSLPIKNNESESITDIQLQLKDGNNNSGIIKLGGKNLGSINIGTDTIDYTIKKLSANRSEVKDKDENISYYNIMFSNLPVGKYKVEVSGSGFKSKEVKDIDISNYSQRVLLSNRASVDNKNKPLNYELFLMGDVNGDGKVDKNDYNEVLENIDSNKKEYDLNRDGKVDIADLDYVHKNLGQNENANSLESIVPTNPIVDTSKVILEENSDTNIQGTVEDLFSGESSGITISPANKGDKISEEKPAVMDIALSEALDMEVINIKAPEGSAPAKGIVEVTDKDGNVQEIPYENKEYVKTLKEEQQEEVNNKEENTEQPDNNLDNTQEEKNDKEESNSNTNEQENNNKESNDKESSSTDKSDLDKDTPKEDNNISKDDNSTTSTYSRSALETYADVQNSDIVINLGKQVAVKKITIKITATTANDRNLAEISKVEFLNNVYKEIPKPDMNIPKINKIATSTAVGNEKVSFYWNNEVNVSAYELILDTIDSKGKVL